MAVYGCIWLYMAVYGGIWLYMAVYGCIWLYIAPRTRPPRPGTRPPWSATQCWNNCQLRGRRLTIISMQFGSISRGFSDVSFGFLCDFFGVCIEFAFSLRFLWGLHRICVHAAISVLWAALAKLLEQFSQACEGGNSAKQSRANQAQSSLVANI